MKKIFISLLAVAALAACSKSEVAYEAANEISFAPVAKNITKGAVGTVTDKGTYPTNQRLGVYANYGLVDPNTTVSGDNIDSFNTGFLNDAVFSYKTVGEISAWGGGYSWPTNGSLIFAGYSMPKEGNVGTERSYNFKTDQLTIKGYTQSTNPAETFDLGWFSRTATSFNYRNQEDAVEVTLSHALAWIEIKVKGEGTTIGDNPWKIKSVTMNKVANTGDAICTGAGAGKAEWVTGTPDKTITIFTGEQSLTSEETVCETKDTDVLVIPQTPTAVDAKNPVATLTVAYTYKSPAGVDMPLQTATVSLALKDANGNSISGGWKSGYKYTYTLTFKASEILIAPDYDKWEEGGNQSVVVE